MYSDSAECSSGGRMPRILVLCAVEEKFDGTGGAVATWVREVYSRSTFEAVVACPASSKQFGRSLIGGLSWRGRGTAAMLGFVRRTARMVGRNPAAATYVLSRGGRWWVRSVQNDASNADLVHIQNRPEFAPMLRAGGYEGPIVCHMHNDLAVRSPSPEALQAVDRWLFCSDFIRNKAISEYSLDPARCATVYNGVDVERYHAPSTPASRRDLIFVGRLEEQKGALQAVEIWASLAAEGQECDLHLIGPTGIGGDTTKSPYAQRIKERVAELNTELAPRRAHVLGPKTHPEALAAMGQARVLLLPCQGIEAFGMVLVEAMAVGTPVVASALGGIPEIVTDGTGTLIDSHDAVRSGTNAVRDYLRATDTDYTDSSQAAILRAHDFAWQGIVLRLENLFERMSADADW